MSNHRTAATTDRPLLFHHHPPPPGIQRSLPESLFTPPQNPFFSLQPIKPQPQASSFKQGIMERSMSSLSLKSILTSSTSTSETQLVNVREHLRKQIGKFLGVSHVDLIEAAVAACFAVDQIPVIGKSIHDILQLHTDPSTILVLIKNILTYRISAYYGDLPSEVGLSYLKNVLRDNSLSALLVSYYVRDEIHPFLISTLRPIILAHIQTLNQPDMDEPQIRHITNDLISALLTNVSKMPIQVRQVLLLLHNQVEHALIRLHRLNPLLLLSNSPTTLVASIPLPQSPAMSPIKPVSPLVGSSAGRRDTTPNSASSKDYPSLRSVVSAPIPPDPVPLLMIDTSVVTSTDMNHSDLPWTAYFSIASSEEQEDLFSSDLTTSSMQNSPNKSTRQNSLGDTSIKNRKLKRNNAVNRRLSQTQFQTLPDQIVSAFYFLRIIGPALTLPDQNGILPKDQTNKSVQRALLMIGKRLMSIANNSETKQGAVDGAQLQFVHEQRKRIKVLIESIVDIPVPNTDATVLPFVMDVPDLADTLSVHSTQNPTVDQHHHQPKHDPVTNTKKIGSFRKLFRSGSLKKKPEFTSMPALGTDILEEPRGPTSPPLGSYNTRSTSLGKLYVDLPQQPSAVPSDVFITQLALGMPKIESWAMANAKPELVSLLQDLNRMLLSFNLTNKPVTRVPSTATLNLEVNTSEPKLSAPHVFLKSFGRKIMNKHESTQSSASLHDVNASAEFGDGADTPSPSSRKSADRWSSSIAHLHKSRHFSMLLPSRQVTTDPTALAHIKPGCCKGRVYSD